MPPKNAGRSLFSEESLALRIAYERERRDMTYEGLAKRMTDVGCPINQSAIYKIEKGQPRRRITVDELVALSQVLELDINELLLPPQLTQYRVVADALQAYVATTHRFAEADRARAQAERHYADVMKQWPDAAEALGDYLKDEWAPDPRSSTSLPPGGVEQWVERMVARASGKAPSDG